MSPTETWGGNVILAVAEHAPSEIDDLERTIADCQATIVEASIRMTALRQMLAIAAPLARPTSLHLEKSA